MTTQQHIPTVHEATGLERFFILRPVVGLLLLVLFIVGGVFAYVSLVKESLPDLAIPQATISTFWPGADPQTIEQEVTDKIENELSSLKGLKKYSSASFDSYSLVAVEFVATADINDSMQRLRSKINDAEAELPRDAEKPTVNQISVDDRPMLTLVLYGDVDSAILSRTATDLEDRLEKVAGVNEVKIGGLRKEAIRIQLLPERLIALGISPTRVRDRIQSANRDMPWGEIESDQLGGALRMVGRFRDINELRKLPIDRLGQSGRVIRLSEIADVRRDLEREETRAFLSNEGEPFRRSIEISLTKVPAADALIAIENAKAAIEEAQSATDWPFGLGVRITTDQSEQIWESLLRVFNNGWQAMLCVFFVLLLMLSWREALIAGLSIPVAFMGALTLVWMFGYTLNEMVLIGMVLALGLLVDVFILMMEGMHEGVYVEKLSFSRSAMWTIRRFALPAFAGQMTTILALAPLIMISGTSGKFIRILPITTIACLICSFIVAIAIDVPLSRYLLKRKAKQDDQHSFVDRLSIRVSNWLASWSKRYTIRNHWTAATSTACGMGLFLVGGIAFSTLPSTMYSKRDGRNLGVTVELPAGTTLDKSQRAADLVGEILRDKPYLENVVKLVGSKSPMVQGSLGEALAPTTADYLVGFSCRFLPREERDLPAYEYVDGLRAEITRAVDKKFAGANVILQAETGEPSAGDPIQIEIVGDSMETLRELSKQVQNTLRETPGAVDVRDNLGNVQVDIQLEPKREALDFYNISHEELASQVRYAMGDQEIGKFVVGNNDDDLEIRMGLAWPSREGSLGGPTRLSELVSVRVFQQDGGTVPAMAVLEPNVGTSPISITRQDGSRSIIVSAKNQDRLPSEIIADVTPKLDSLADSWPSGFRYKFGGDAEESAEAFGSAGYAMIVALFLVFALLVMLFGSFAQPFIILLTIPLALTGTFVGFYLLKMPFSFTAVIGVVSLIGIVVNDAIVMVETMNDYLRRGYDVVDAAARGGADRLRPILSTSITTIIGLIPLALSDAMWEPLCFAIIFGLIASTVLSLAIIPAMYVLLTRPHRDVIAEL
ncbi:efflux RND transporter permease subunit [Rhodopirellula bahusiensis]|uniref:Acriflavin resistance protein n=1 Tax=Rhodopirellula bahusiensis TaxID=2014065 RepID=A0A2G1W785_9BACT|nr:efflux RND transporter permease subunit [Rhodopirellula bahusiensis]PHQ34895.1 acriflavin resistance protein [Rhodopirellula bahusiensis]